MNWFHALKEPRHHIMPEPVINMNVPNIDTKHDKTPDERNRTTCLTCPHYGCVEELAGKGKQRCDRIKRGVHE